MVAQMRYMYRDRQALIKDLISIPQDFFRTHCWEKTQFLEKGFLISFWDR